MVALISFLLNVVASLFKSKSRLEAENAALRRQLIVLQRKVRGRVQFTNSDCLFSVQLYRWCPSVLKAVTIIRLKASCAGIVPVSPLLALEIALPRRPAAHGVAHLVAISAFSRQLTYTCRARTAPPSFGIQPWGQRGKG